MSRQEIIQNVMGEMFNEIPGYILERQMGPELVQYLFYLGDYTTQNKIHRTKYHENGIDIYVSNSSTNHAIEFTTNENKNPKDDYDTVARDDKSVDVYWFVTTEEWEDPEYPNCDVIFEGVGANSLLEVIELKTGANPAGGTNVGVLKKFADLTGYDDEHLGPVDFRKLSTRSFGCEIAIKPPLVAMWPRSHHKEFMQKLEDTSHSLTKSANGDLRDFLETDENHDDLFHLQIETHRHTINIDRPSTVVNPPPEMSTEFEVDLSEKGVEDTFVPIQLCDGTKDNPQKLHIQPMDWLRS